MDRAVLILLFSVLVATVSCSCTHPIFCNGPVLDAIQKAHIFEDGKCFVDLPLRVHPNETLEAFNKIADKTNVNSLLKFLKDHFAPAGSDLLPFTPSDWTPTPDFLSNIKNKELKEWGGFINLRWQLLTRVFSQNTSCPECYSSIPVKNHFVIAGGRFREFYYWDTYWIMKGLLASNMFATAKGMLENMLDVVDKHGFVPNGGRVYYLNRSQPPLLTLMVRDYLVASRDSAFLTRALPTLAKEYTFFMQNKLVKMPNGGVLNRFNVEVNYPRPESYSIDYELAQTVAESERASLYTGLATAAESGWDFSSRWFKNVSSLTTIETSNRVPVDLNSIMYMNEMTLAQFYSISSDMATARTFLLAAINRADTMHRYLWNESALSWFDYNIRTKQHTAEFYPSNWSPLWARAYPLPHSSVSHLMHVLEKLSNDLGSLEFFQTHHQAIAANLLDIGNFTHAYFDRVKIEKIVQRGSQALSMPAGVPSSFLPTGQQWDYPNAWAPSQFMIVEALRSVPSSPVMADAATKLIKQWVDTNYCAWKRTGHMFEKYNATAIGAIGSGGEYKVQDGFGWTNGFMLTLLRDFGQSLMLPICPPISVSQDRQSTDFPAASTQASHKDEHVMMCSEFTNEFINSR